MLQKLSLFLGLFLLLMGACATKQTLSADLPTLSFLSDIQPILSANCSVGSRCHSGNGHLASLDTYDGAIRYVQAGDPHASRLYTTTRDYLGNVMPPSPNTRLTDEQMTKIYVWISQGAPNN
jgi:uncharacterized membrane protein